MSAPATAIPETGKPAGMAVLLATCITALVVNANTSAVSILLPAISEDTGSSLDTLQWAVTGYSLVGAAVIVTSGALGDVYGRRLLFLLGIGLFVASCALIGLSTGGAGVIAGRFIQGAAGATILASGLSLLSVASSGQEQVKAVSLWGAASALGAAAGPLLGGVLVEISGWQALFWIDAGIAALCIPLTLRGIAESRDEHRARSIDYGGTILVAAILAPIIYGMTEAADWGWLSVQTIATFSISVIAVVAFYQLEKRVKSPLIDLNLLKNRGLVGATIVILIGAGTINGMGYLLSLYCQDPVSFDMTPLMAGLAILPATVGLVAITPFVPKLTAKLGMRQTIVVGLLSCTVGFTFMAFTQASWGYAVLVLPILLVAIGMGLSNNPATSASTASVSTDQVGAASGISNMARYVGAAVVTAAVASIYSGVTASRIDAGKAPDDALAAGFAVSMALLAAVCGLGLLAGLWANHRHTQQTRLVDSAAAAAAHLHTIVPPGDHEPAPANG